MTISVVIPCYNRKSTLWRAVSSARAYGGADVEIIVVDDCSTEPLCPEDAAGVGVRLLRLERNGGAGPARNHGVDAASHEIVAFLDADDEWLPAAQQRINLVAPGRCAVGAYRWRDPRSGREGSVRIPQNPPGEWLPYQNPIHPSSLVVRRCDFRRAGGFPEDRDCAEDWILCLRLLRAGVGIGIVQAPVLLAHLDGGNTTADRRVLVTHALGAARLMRTEGLGSPAELARSGAVVHARVAGFYANDACWPKAAEHARAALAGKAGPHVARELARVPVQAARGFMRRRREQAPAVASDDTDHGT